MNQSLSKSADIIRQCLKKRAKGKKGGREKKKLLIYNRISVSAKWQLPLITHGSLQLEIQIQTLQDANFHGTSHGESLRWQLRRTMQNTLHGSYFVLPLRLLYILDFVYIYIYVCSSQCPIRVEGFRRKGSETAASVQLHCSFNQLNNAVKAPTHSQHAEMQVQN